jgi:hypothetical protein
VPAELIVVWLNTIPATYAERGEQLRDEVTTPRLMLLDAFARVMRTPAVQAVPQPVRVAAGGPGAAAADGSLPDWLADDSAGTSSDAPPPPAAAPRSPDAAPAQPPRPPDDDTGLPDWLRG